MFVQRITGGWLLFFTGCVVANHAAQVQLSVYDAVYSGLCLPLLLSCIFDQKWARVAQVAVILGTGAMMVAMSEYSRPFGFLIMAVGQVYAYTYSLLDRYLRTKIVVMILVYAALFFATLSNFGNTVLWVFMAVTSMGGIWLPVWNMIESKRKADEIIKKDLEQKVKTSQALVAEIVSAGVVLVEEIKHKEAGNGCEG